MKIKWAIADLSPTILKNMVGKRATSRRQLIHSPKAGSHFMDLRCTLMGFERNYPVKILSNQTIRFKPVLLLSRNTKKIFLPIILKYDLV